MWKIKIITLSDAHQRRAHLTSTLDALKLPFELHLGVDARDGIPDEYRTMVDLDGARRVLGREFTGAEVGCALSHLLLAKQIVDLDLPGVIVFEDDAILSEGDYFKVFLRERVYERADLIQLSYGPARIWRSGFGRRREARQLVTERLVHNAGLATGYSLSNRGAHFLWKTALPLRCVADWPCDLRPLKPRILVPKLVGRPPEGVTSYLHEARLAASCAGSASRRSRLEMKNPRPLGYSVFHRFFSKTVF